jgi:hypothetical protein
MTDRIIVATFNDTNAAYDAASAIKGLKEAGVADFKLKTGVMIKKDDRGNVALLEKQGPSSSWNGSWDGYWGSDWADRRSARHGAGGGVGCNDRVEWRCRHGSTRH